MRVLKKVILGHLRAVVIVMSRVKKLIAKVKIAQKQLNMADDVYRDTLKRRFGKDSATKLTEPQLIRMVEHMEGLGFVDNSPKKKLPTQHHKNPQLNYMIGMWLMLGKRGEVENKSNEALLVWCNNQDTLKTPVDSLEWLTVKQKRELIEQLKKWVERTNVKQTATSKNNGGTRTAN